LTGDIDSLKRLEDAGASAVVLPSVFEEQLSEDAAAMCVDLERGSESFAEATAYFPRIDRFAMGPESYLEHVRRAKEALKIPVYASINACTPGGWTAYARMVQEAGADGLELNIYAVSADFLATTTEIEDSYLRVIQAVRSAVTMPLAVKLSPFFTSLAAFAARLDAVGTDGLVLFNRFYQPDIDLETLEVEPGITLSRSESLRLPLRWIAILRGRVHASLGATGGIHSGADALKAVLVGADAVFLCSSLLKHGIAHIKTIEQEMVRWMEAKEYGSLQQMKGSMSSAHIKDPSLYERTLYVRAITQRPGALAGA
jgi:dihydroorotate dehydrogenase (fumarate)